MYDILLGFITVLMLLRMYSFLNMGERCLLNIHVFIDDKFCRNDVYLQISQELTCYLVDEMIYRQMNYINIMQ